MILVRKRGRKWGTVRFIDIQQWHSNVAPLGPTFNTEVALLVPTALLTLVNSSKKVIRIKFTEFFWLERLTDPVHLESDSSLFSHTIHQDSSVFSHTVHQDTRVLSHTVHLDSSLLSHSVLQENLFLSHIIHYSSSLLSPTVYYDSSVFSHTILQFSSGLKHTVCKDSSVHNSAVRQCS
jgi:hypothetical protein